MTSKVEICNLALIEARADATIASLDERSVNAERCNRLYDICRKEVLSNYPWVFATKFVNLARLSSDVEGAKYAYVYPAEAVRIVNVFKDEEDYKHKNYRIKPRNNTRVSYFEGQKVILCNYEQPFAEIIYDEQMEENFPPLFVRLLYLTMALRLAKLSSADNDYLKIIYSQIEEEGNKARVQSVGEDDNHLCVDDDYYIRVRG